MRIKKILQISASLLIAILLCSILIACDNTVEPADTEVNTEESADTVIATDTEETNKATEATSDTEAKTEPTEPVSGVKEYKLADVIDKLKLHGRIASLSSGLACDATGCGIEFRIKAKGKVVLKALADGDEGKFTVYVDGERKKSTFKADPGAVDSLNIAFFGEEGEHTIKVVKQTEAQFTKCELISLEFEGEFLDPPAYTDKYIEVIGDSITSGVGNLIKNAVATSPSQDGTQAFPYLTAEALGVDGSFVTCGGLGLAKSAKDFIASDFYPAASFFRDREAAYSFDRKADLVVINLGTNDVEYGADENALKAETKNFINLIREKNGNVPIIFTYNLMNDAKASEWIGAALTEMGGESAGLYQLKLNKNQEGGSAHPSLEGHATAAGILTAFIEQKGFLK